MKDFIKILTVTLAFAKYVGSLRWCLVRKALRGLWEVTRWIFNLCHYISDFQHLLSVRPYFVLNQPLNSVTTHLRHGKKVRILSQLRESDLPVGDASRTLPSSNGLLEVLPIYQLSVDYIGSKVYSVS